MHIKGSKVQGLVRIVVLLSFGGRGKITFYNTHFTIISLLFCKLFSKQIQFKVN